MVDATAGEVMGDMGGDDGCKKRFRVEQRS